MNSLGFFLVNHPFTLNQKYLSYILLLLNMAPILSPTWFSLIVFLFFTALPGALWGCHRRLTFISQTVGLMLQLFSFFVIIMFICHATHHLVDGLLDLLSFQGGKFSLKKLGHIIY